MNKIFLLQLETPVGAACILSEPLPSSKDPRVLFAGDYTDPNAPGSMHGARNSGVSYVNIIISH